MSMLFLPSSFVYGKKNDLAAALLWPAEEGQSPFLSQTPRAIWVLPPKGVIGLSYFLPPSLSIKNPLLQALTPLSSQTRMKTFN